MLPRHILVIAAWLGAVVDRARRGVAPLAEDWEAINKDLASFGDALPEFGASPVYAHRPCWEELAPLLRELHRALKGTPHERSTWIEVLERVSFCPPDDVVEDLLQREVDTNYLGHLPLPDRLLWRFAEHVDEALLTLAKRRFVDDGYSVDQFEEVLNSFPTHEWMLDSLARMVDGPSEKATVVARYVARHPDSAALIEHLPKPFLKELEAIRE